MTFMISQGQVKDINEVFIQWWDCSSQSTTGEAIIEKYNVPWNHYTKKNASLFDV